MPEKVGSRTVECISRRRIFERDVLIRRVARAEFRRFQTKDLSAKSARDLQFVVEKLEQILRVKRVARLFGAGEKVAETVECEPVVAVFFVFIFVAERDRVDAVRCPVKMSVCGVYRAVKNARFVAAERLIWNA